MSKQPLILHGTCIAVQGRGVLILGPSGAGKSALALQLIALGAVLVADDRTVLDVDEGVIFASTPPAIAGLIEAREVGIIATDHLAAAPLHLVVDLSKTETERLPEKHTHDVMGQIVPCLHNSAQRHFPAAIMLYMMQKMQE